MIRLLSVGLAAVIFAAPAFGQDKQIIYDSNGVRIGTIEQEAPWSDKRVIYDANGNRVGTIEPQAPWSDKSVIRDNSGVTQETITPDPFGAPADPVATPAGDSGN